VIALAQGGSLETVVPLNRRTKDVTVQQTDVDASPTGVFFFHTSAAALAEAVRFFEVHQAVFDPLVLRQHAMRFDRQQFKQRIRQFLDAARAAHGECSSRHGTPLTGARFSDAQKA
jgi:hypothetical protein